MDLIRRLVILAFVVTADAMDAIRRIVLLILSAAAMVALIVSMAQARWLIAAVVFVAWLAVTFLAAREVGYALSADDAWDDDDPIMAGLVARCRDMATPELLAWHKETTRRANAGDPVELGDDILLAIEIALRQRRIPFCPCGAPLPDGVHMTTCQES
ncbi:hypothetical protein [Streptomyces albidoflavus]|uniref:hypothetical protein n=1 Tax=Streptomyces albidoflavus TaxID=1886 RepID=UPI00332D424E